MSTHNNESNESNNIDKNLFNEDMLNLNSIPIHTGSDLSRCQGSIISQEERLQRI